MTRSETKASVVQPRGDNLNQGRQSFGFERVNFNDGFGRSISYDVEPDREDDAGGRIVTDMGASLVL